MKVLFNLKCAIAFLSPFLAWIQLLSIPISYVSLAWSATWAYLQQRLPDYSDPDPPKNGHFFLVFFLFFLSSFGFVAAWSVILAYVKWMVLVIIIFVFTVNLLVCFPVYWYTFRHAFRYESWIRKADEFTRKEETEKKRKKMGRNGPYNRLMFKSIVASIMVPSVTFHHKAPIVFVSTVVTAVNLIITLLLVTQTTLIINSKNEFSANFPLFSCFVTDNETLTENICLLGENEHVTDCGQSYWRVCSKNCLDSVRFCGQGEATFQMFQTVSNVLICALCGCILLSAILQWMSNYLNVYKYTKHICGKVYIHRSILFLAIEEKDIETLESVLAEKNVDKNILKRPNRNGQTPLHFAISVGDIDMIKLLISKTFDKPLFEINESSPLHIATKVCDKIHQILSICC